MRSVVPFSFLCGLTVFSVSCSNARYERCNDSDERFEAPVVKQSYVHKYGMEVEKNEWSSRGQNGKIVSTLKTGVIVTTNYMDGYPQGETTYTFPHSGALQRVETYDSGLLVMEQEMYPTGKLKRQVEYSNPAQKTVTTWYENGSPHTREKYNDNKLLEGDYYSGNDQVESKIDDGEGTRTNRDEFGVLVSRDKFLYGQLAMQTFYYPNGTPKEVIPYVNGKINGQKKTFLSGGEPRTVEGWTDDRQEGITLVYQNGEKISEVPYLNGVKNGVEYRFKDGRFIVEEIHWKNGKKHGPSTAHVGDDSVISWYYDGQEVQKKQYERLTNPKPR